MARRKIKNPSYRNFLDHGLINIITAEQFEKALNNAVGSYGAYKAQARALLITLYYTGARPNEVLRIKSKDIDKEDTYVKIFVQGSKRGLPRTLYFPYSINHIKELYKFAISTILDKDFSNLIFVSLIKSC